MQGCEKEDCELKQNQFVNLHKIEIFYTLPKIYRLFDGTTKVLFKKYKCH